MQIKSIWDNGGETCDRYTVVTNEPWNDFEKNTFMALGMSGNPEHPQGVSQFCSAMEGRHLGKKVDIKELPDDIQKHIKWRLA